VSAWHDWIERLRTVAFRQQEERELDEELSFHLEMEAEQHRRSGLSPAEARRRSAIALGGLARTKDEVRDARGTRWLDELAGDVAVSFRGLRRAPAFTATVVGMLAIGIGANTAIFTLIDAVIVRDLPVSHPEELVAIGDPALVNSTGRALTAQAISY